MRIHRSTTICASSLLAVALAAVPLTAAQETLAATINIESSEGSFDMTFTSGGDVSRMDIKQPENEMSILMSVVSMTMIMHAQKTYMEWTKEMMDRMQAMMGGMGNMPGRPGGRGGETADTFDPSQIVFERTGNTDTINGHSAFEVAYSDDQGREGSLWMTDDIQIGLMEAMLQVSTVMIDNPMMNMGRMGGRGGSNPMSNIRSQLALARAQGLPEGKVIRIVDPAGGTVMTLAGVGAPAAGWDKVPAGYERQQMPFGRQD